MAPVSQTASIIERALEETIAHLSKGQSSPKARAILIEARRLRSMVASWAAIPPRATTRRELYQNAMTLFQKAGVAAPQVDPASFPDPTLRPSTSAPAASPLPASEEPTLPGPSSTRRSSAPPRSSQPPRSSPPSARSSPPPPRTSPSSRPRRRTDPAPNVLFVNPDALDWRELPAARGVAVKVLHRDEASGLFRALVRMDPGAELARHHHSVHEEIFVIEGSVLHEAIEVRAGEYGHADPGSTHAPIRSPSGCTLFFVGSESDEIFGHPKG